MDTILKHQFKTAVDSKKEGNFQDFVNVLFLKKYGSNFTPVKAKRDKGCDGILSNKVIIAAYAPDKPNLREFKKKITDDYQKYKCNWQNNHPEWWLIYNGEFTSEMIQYLQSSCGGHQRLDANHILNMIDELPHYKKRDLATYLGIDDQYIVNDIMKIVVEDLLKICDGNENLKKPYSSPPYIVDKITVNYCEEDIDEALQEYENAVEYFAQLKDVLKLYQDFEIDSLKTKVSSTYNKLTGDFKTRLNNLVDLLSERNKNDDYYVMFLRIVLIYFFEICLIGKRTESEG